MRGLKRRSARAGQGLLALAMVSGCVKANEVFDDPLATDGATSTGTDSDKTTTAPSTAETSEGSDGGSGTTALTSSTTEAPTTEGNGECSDSYEPNNDRAQAVEVSGLIAVSTARLSAMMGSDDPDWFKFRGFASETPQLSVSSNTEEPMFICAYVQCIDGAFDFVEDCAEGSDPAVMDDLEGCCGDRIAQFNYSCVGSGADANVYISVFAENDACFEYDLTYRF